MTRVLPLLAGALALGILSATSLPVTVSAAPGTAPPPPPRDDRADPVRWSWAGLGPGGSPVNSHTFVGGGTTPIVGRFVDFQAPDIVWYTPGPGGDELWSGEGGLSFDEGPLSISGTYTPHVGTFSTPDGRDDILWYSTTGTSQLWDYNPDETLTTRSLPGVTGAGSILIGDFAGDGVEDVIRYRAGAASDSWWDLRSADVLTRPLSVAGTYRPVVGRFDNDLADDILWYAPGSGADRLWDMSSGGSRTEVALTISGSYTPVVGSFSGDGVEDVIWYAPGPGGDSLWNFQPDGRQTKPLAINGTYAPVPCQCDDQPLEDVYWFGAGVGNQVVWAFLDDDPLTVTSLGAYSEGRTPVATAALTVGSDREYLLVRH